jgi:hypothetical protein
MKFALVNGCKTEARPELQGACINCKSNTIAKCGKVKIWHWAHKSKMPCDPWWEDETEWHRAWKNHFPSEWQENIRVDSTNGEKHIADIKTASGFVIEFQRSSIQPAEMQSREAFYENMVWVVDGTRLKRDYPRFCKGFSDRRPTVVEGFFRSFFPDECFPANWLKSSVPVYFDFQGSNPVDQQDEMRSLLWCLFPSGVEGHTVFAGVLRKQFIELSSTAHYLLFAHEKIGCISQHIRLQREIAEAHARREGLKWASQPYSRRFVRRRL